MSTEHSAGNRSGSPLMRFITNPVGGGLLMISAAAGIHHTANQIQAGIDALNTRGGPAVSGWIQQKFQLQPAGAKAEVRADAAMVRTPPRTRL